MMKKFRNLICLILSVSVLFCSAFSISSSAKTIHGPEVSVTVSEIGDDRLNVDIGYISNPGVGAITITLGYDSDSFAISKDFSRNRYFYECTLAGYSVVDHPKDGYISFVQADDSNANDNTSVGTFLTVRFIKTGNVPGKHWFKIGNIYRKLGDNLTGCFANFAHDTLIPTVKNDYYFIPATEDNPCVKHDYEFKSKVEPTCIAEGYSIHECQTCGKLEKRDTVSALGHDFSDNYTVDRPASEGVAKIISRHCKRCGERTDIKYISSDDKKGDDSKSSSESSGSNQNSSSDNDSKTASDNASKGNDKGSKDKDGKNSSGSDGNKNSSNNTSVKDGGSDTEHKDGNKADGGKPDKPPKKDEHKGIFGKTLEKILGKKTVGKKVSEKKKSGDSVVSADDLIEDVKDGDYFYFGGVKLPNIVKTVGDFFAKIHAYLFGAGDKDGIITIIINGIKAYFFA